MIVHGIDSVVLGVGDLAAARAFYSETLGLAEKAVSGQVVEYDLGAGPALVVRQQTGVEPGARPRQTPRVWLRVLDARAEAEALRAAGVRLVAEPFEARTGWVVEVADDWGNVVGFADQAG